MDYPKLIQPVSDDILRAIVRKNLGPDAVLIENRLLQGGQFNTAYVLETRAPELRIVLRMAPPDDRPLFRYERGMMAAEPWIYRQMELAGIPVARVLALDDTRSVIDRTYILHEFIDGVPITHSTVPEEAQAGLCREAGALIARMHKMRSESFGWPVGDGSLRGGPGWTRVFGDLLEETVNEACAANILHTEAAGVVTQRYAHHHGAFDACREPVLVHNDIWAPNILAGKHNGGWRVRAIIDADRALFAEREFEYILWDNDSIRVHFMEGYGIPLSETPDALLRRHFYRFYWYLFAAWAYTKQIWRPDVKEWSLNEAMASYQVIRAL